MPRHLLTTTAAFVLAAVASAQTVEISGQMTIALNYDGLSNTFLGPEVAAQHQEDDVFITFSGESVGWQYQVETGLFWSAWDEAEVTLTHANLGSFQLGNESIEWSKDLVGDALKLGAYVDPSHLESTLQVSLEGTIGGVSYDATIQNDANRSFDVELEVPVQGVTVTTIASGELDDTSTLDYLIAASTDVFGLETTLVGHSTGDFDVRLKAGAFSVASSLQDGDAFNNLTLRYNQELTEQMEVDIEAALVNQVNVAAWLILRF